MTDKILVIDDSTTIQKVVKIACEPFAIFVSTANSYLEAISETKQALPQLVIADASLPGIKGAEDYAQLQSRLQGVPFIILQGSYEEVDIAAFESCGFHLFLKKPFEAHVLIQNIETALGRALLNRQNRRKVSNGPGADHLPPPPPPLQVAKTREFSGPEPTQTKTPPPIKPPIPSPVSLSLGNLADEEESDTFTTDRLMSSPHDDANDVATEDYDHSFVADDVFPEDDEMGHAEPTDLYMDEDEGQEQFAPPPPPPIDLGSEDGLSDLDDFLPSSSSSSNMQATSAAPASPRREFSELERTSTKVPEPPPVKSSWSKAAHTDAQGLVEPFLREELAALVRQTVIEYCDRHFSRVAREILSDEIKKLTDEKARLLMDK
ncbi:MAG: response regulator [Oligoflexus sp.]